MGDNLSEMEAEEAEEVGEGSGNHSIAQEQQQGQQQKHGSIECVDENMTIHPKWLMLQRLGGESFLEQALLEGSVVEVRHNDEIWYRVLNE